MEKIKLEIVYLPVNEITPYKNNAKQHPQKQIDEIKASIREFGMNDPIAICGKDNLIVEGHGRLIACKQLGIDTVPVIRLDHLNDEQRRAYTLAHNQLTMNTGFDLDVLQKEIEDISFDMSEFGFDNIEESNVKLEEDDYELDEEKERPEPKSKLGDIYKLGDHYLMCGDSTDKSYVDQLMSVGGKVMADMVMTDPPYNVNVSNSDGLTIENDNMESGAFARFLDDAFSNLSDNLKPGGAFYIWYGDSEDVAFRTAAFKNGLSIRQCLIWVKNTFNLGRQDYQWRHEPCLYGWKEGNGHYFIYDRTQDTVIEQKPIVFDELSQVEAIKILKKIYDENVPTTVYKENKPAKNDIHPTMKPVGMIGKLIANSSKKGETVLDLFGGGGFNLNSVSAARPQVPYDGIRSTLCRCDNRQMATVYRYDRRTGKITMDFVDSMCVNGVSKENGKGNYATTDRSTQYNRDGQLLRATSQRRNRILGGRAKALPHHSMVRELGRYRNILSRQQLKTLRGQILSGDEIGAKKGLTKLITERIKCHA